MSRDMYAWGNCAGVHPLMPAVNSKLMRKAMQAANETARRAADEAVAQARAAEALEHHLRSLLRQPAAQEAPVDAGDAGGLVDAAAGSAAALPGGEVHFANDTARHQLAILERWGYLDKARSVETISARPACDMTSRMWLRLPVMPSLASRG